jgi:hypothetical protein
MRDCLVRSVTSVRCALQTGTEPYMRTLLLHPKQRIHDLQAASCSYSAGESDAPLHALPCAVMHSMWPPTLVTCTMLVPLLWLCGGSISDAQPDFLMPHGTMMQSAQELVRRRDRTRKHRANKLLQACGLLPISGSSRTAAAAGQGACTPMALCEAL